MAEVDHVKVRWSYSKEVPYTFDDILLVPQYSTIASRKEVSLRTEVCGVDLDLPVLSAPMDTVSGPEMLEVMREAGGMGILHRYPTPGDLCDHWDWFAEKAMPTIGIDKEYFWGLLKIFGVPPITKQDDGPFPPMICIDVSHADHSLVIDFIKYAKHCRPQLKLLVGNVATSGGAARLIEAGADGIKVGIGPGSCCTTRTTTGHGYPQASAIENVASLREDYSYRFTLIADGGIRNAGDIAKALALGADAVMVGSLLAGSSATPGDIQTIDGKQYKAFRGMASRGAQNAIKGSSFSVEGVETVTPYKGETKDILLSIEENLKAALSYSGARNLTEFRQRALMTRVTLSTSAENHPHILGVF